MTDNATSPPGGNYGRDDEILDHVMRYRITTPAVLHRLFFDDSDRNAVTKVTSRLCQQGYLASYELYGSNVYFALGKNGARWKGLRATLVKPLGRQALYREFGVLAFCCLQPTLRERQRFSEIARNQPQIIAPHIDSSHYYVDHDESGSLTRLGCIWVEAGGSADHVVRIVRQKIVEPRQAVPALRQAIQQGGFVVAIVTYHEEKRQQIIHALKSLQTTVHFRIEVVPELRLLLPGLR